MHWLLHVCVYECVGTLQATIVHIHSAVVCCVRILPVQLSCMLSVYVRVRDHGAFASVSLAVDLVRMAFCACIAVVFSLSF